MVSASVGPLKLHHVRDEHDSLLPVAVLEQGISHRIILIDKDPAIPAAPIPHNPLGPWLFWPIKKRGDFASSDERLHSSSSIFVVPFKEVHRCKAGLLTIPKCAHFGIKNREETPS